MTEQAPAYDLVVVRGPDPGTTFPLDAGTHVVGRSSSCDVTLDDPEISRRHAYVSIDATGIRIRDAGSMNGTIVDGVAIAGETEVRPRQIVELGGAAISFQIPTAPKAVTLDDLPPPAGEWSLPIGLGPRRSPVHAELAPGHFVIVGPYRSGRTSALGTLAAAAHALDSPPALHLFSPRPSRLTESGTWASVVVGRDEVELALATSGGIVGAGTKALVLIDDGDELFDDDNEELERVLRGARNSAVRFVIAAETKAAHRCFGGWFLEALKQQHGLLLQPDEVLDGQLFGVELPRATERFGPGGGYLVERGAISAVQIATHLQE